MPQNFVFTDKDLSLAKKEARERCAERRRLLKIEIEEQRRRGKKIRIKMSDCRKEPLSPFPSSTEGWNTSKYYAWNAWCELHRTLIKMLKDLCPKRKIEHGNKYPMLALEHDGNGTFTLHILQAWISERLNLPTTITIKEDPSYEYYPLEAHNKFILAISEIRKSELQKKE